MSEDKGLLQLMYMFFLGLLLAIFVGVGISTFYPAPEAPEYPVILETVGGKTLTAEQQAVEAKYNIASRAYNEKMKPYNRNVSIIALIASLVFFSVSLIYEKKMRIIGDGVMLGGLFTLLYSIGRGFASEDSRYVFVVVTAGLIVVLYLGYHRFIKPHNLADAAEKAATIASPKQTKNK